MVAMATKQHFKHCRTWSQLKAQQPLLLCSTISTTSWNYIFLEQDGFEVVIWCVGWCVKKNESPKVCFYKCKSILQKIQSIECRSFYTPVFRRDVLWYGAVHPSVRSSVRPTVRTKKHRCKWRIFFKFCTQVCLGVPSVNLLFVLSCLIKYAHNSIISDFSIFGIHRVIFSCDQAAIWLVQSVCLSVRPSVCHTFFTMFPSSYHHEIFRSYYHGQKWCPCKRSRSEVKGQGHRGQHPT